MFGYQVSPCGKGPDNLRRDDGIAASRDGWLGVRGGFKVDMMAIDFGNFKAAIDAARIVGMNRLGPAEQFAFCARPGPVSPGGP